jgi:hypothetical protein
MSTGIIKPLGTEAVINTSSYSAYGNSTLVRLAHRSATTTSAVITCKDASNTTTKWTMSIVGGDSLIVQKSATDILVSNSTDTSVTAVAVAYKA